MVEKNGFYEIYVPGYKDRNTHDCSDFKGITGELDFIQSLGVKRI